jgi:paraquat-inducible protein A
VASSDLPEGLTGIGIAPKLAQARREGMRARPTTDDLASASIEGTLAHREGGWGRLIGSLLVIMLLILPMTWAMPLFRTEFLVFLTNEVTVLGAVRTLANTDIFLCAIVVLFGMIIPFVKLTALIYAWFVLPYPRAFIWISRLSTISKFSMLDVMLIAITIAGLKGVGLGKVEIEYGFYIYSTVVLSILILSSWMQFKVKIRTQAIVRIKKFTVERFWAEEA